MSKKDYNETMDAALGAYEESTGGPPDTRDYVALEDAVRAEVERDDA